CFYRSRSHLSLPPFPTRRSSDLLLVSPVLLYGSAAGLSNVDGVLGISLFLYLLLARRSEWAAGVVLGCLPWVRHELAVFSVAFRSEEHTSELQSLRHLVCRLLLE